MPPAAPEYCGGIGGKVNAEDGPALPRNHSTISASRYPRSRIGAMDAVKWCRSQSLYSSPGVKTCGVSGPSGTSPASIRTGTTTAPGATASAASFPGGSRTHRPAVSRSTSPQCTETLPV
ncbi:MAG: hypothetical protein ACTMIG_08570 [Corynebacterium variabile]|uniref:hypothetical protein n=1 Tax=Corynebacterium variabile TaxID=1727 RepID=UPI00264A4D07|nr:hypothetical protein [Corynebacterium variabile]MDN6662886.1 hypothetical protein [Corynebacterium variabile]